MNLACEMTKGRASLCGHSLTSPFLLCMKVDVLACGLPKACWTLVIFSVIMMVLFHFLLLSKIP